MDGIYVGYFTGTGGNGVGMFVLREGVLTGADAMGTLYDGKYLLTAEGYSFRARVKLQPNIRTVQGTNTGEDGFSYDATFDLPRDPESQPFFALTTPLGPVNVKLQKLRGI